MTLRKTLLAAACSLATLLPLAAAQAADVKTLHNGELKVGMEISYPPFEYYEGENVAGFDPELATLLAKQMNLGISFNDTRIPNLILGLNANRYDAIISGLYIRTERLEQADAIPYAQTGAAMMVKAGATTRPSTPEELCGLTAGLQQGTAWIMNLQEVSKGYCADNGLQPITVNEYPTTAEATQALLSGHLNVHLEIDAAAQMIVDKSRGRIELSTPTSIYPQVLGIYVKKGNTQLLNSLQQALDAIKANGEYSALIKKYNLEEA